MSIILHVYLQRHDVKSRLRISYHRNKEQERQLCGVVAKINIWLEKQIVSCES